MFCTLLCSDFLLVIPPSAEHESHDEFFVCSVLSGCNSTADFPVAVVDKATVRPGFEANNFYCLALSAAGGVYK